MTASFRVSVRISCILLSAIASRESVAQIGPKKGLPEPFASRRVVIQIKDATMAALLEAISAQTGVSIMTDGAPRRASAELNYSGIADEALHRVADLFDYKWRVSSAGVILMTKRFSDPDERPQVNLPEMRRVSQEIMRLLDFLPYDREPHSEGRTLTALMNALEPGQVERMKAGSLLKVGTLSPRQRALVEAAVLTNTLAPTYQAWFKLYQQLTNLNQSWLQARKVDFPIEIKSDIVIIEEPPSTPPTATKYKVDVNSDFVAHFYTPLGAGRTIAASMHVAIQGIGKAKLEQ